MLKRKIPAVLLMILMCFIITSTATAADADYRCSAISYKNGSSVVTALKPSEELSASMTVSKTGVEERLTFAVFLYQDELLIDAGIECKDVGSASVAFTASVTLPENVENCYVNAMLWDSMAGMNAICNAGIFPGGSADLKGIKINGVEVADFSPDNFEYSGTVAAGAEYAPSIEASAVDNGTKIRVVPPSEYPGKSVINVTSADGRETKEYTINYSADKELAGNIRMTDRLLNTDVDLGLGGGQFSQMPKILKNLQVGSPLVCDRDNQPAKTVPSEILGKDYLAACMQWLWGAYADRTLYESEIADWVTFTLYRSATVKVYTQARCPEYFEGYEQKNSALSNDDTAFSVEYKKHYDVTDPAGLDINLPSGRGKMGLWLVVLDYDGYNNK